SSSDTRARLTMTDDRVRRKSRRRYSLVPLRCRSSAAPLPGHPHTKGSTNMKRSLIALSLAALLPLAAQADDKLSYTYIEADYVNVDSDADGFGVRGSFEFGNSGFYGFGAYNWLETDVGSIDFETSELGF